MESAPFAFEVMVAGRGQRDLGTKQLDDHLDFGAPTTNRTMIPSAAKCLFTPRSILLRLQSRSATKPSHSTGLHALVPSPFYPSRIPSRAPPSAGISLAMASSASSSPNGPRTKKTDSREGREKGRWGVVPHVSGDEFLAVFLRVQRDAAKDLAGAQAPGLRKGRDRRLDARARGEALCAFASRRLCVGIVSNHWTTRILRAGRRAACAERDGTRWTGEESMIFWRA